MGGKALERNNEGDEYQRQNCERFCGSGLQTVRFGWEAIRWPYHYTVIPGELGEFVKACYKIPTGGDVTGNEDAKCQGRKWVHSLGCYC